jgi:hypothetical protein
MTSEKLTTVGIFCKPDATFSAKDGPPRHIILQYYGFKNLCTYIKFRDGPTNRLSLLVGTFSSRQKAPTSRFGDQLMSDVTGLDRKVTLEAIFKHQLKSDH